MQRDMEVGHKPLGLCHEGDDFVSEQVGLDGGYPETINCFHVVQRFHQVDEPVAAAAITDAEIADVQTGKYDFFNPLAPPLASLVIAQLGGSEIVRQSCRERGCHEGKM